MSWSSCETPLAFDLRNAVMNDDTWFVKSIFCCRLVSQNSWIVGWYSLAYIAPTEIQLSLYHLLVESCGFLQTDSSTSYLWGTRINLSYVAMVRYDRKFGLRLLLLYLVLPSQYPKTTPQLVGIYLNTTRYRV